MTVAECGEFHNMGEYHEDIASVDEALAIFHQIPPERMNGIPSIGINVHTEGTESHQDAAIDIISGKVADLEILDNVPGISNNPKAMEIITELIDKIPDMEVRGSWEKWQASLKNEQRITERFSIKEKLLEKKAIIDQKSKGDKLAQERDTEKAKGNVR